MTNISLQVKNRNHSIDNTLLIGLIVIGIGCFISALVFDSYLLLLVPFGVLVGYITLVDYSVLYLLLFATIPFSIEYYLPNGTGMDLPTEPLMLALTGIGFVLLLYHFLDIKVIYFKHPISSLLLLHIIWILMTAILSTEPIVSFKFLLAKLWYVIPFYFLTMYFIRQDGFVYRWMRFTSITLFMVLLYVMYRHIQLGLGFTTINKSVGPFFRNHVNYAALVAVFLPFIWVMYRKTKSVFYLGMIVLSIVAVYYSYTRAAYVTVLVLPLIYLAVKWRLLKPGVWIGALSIPFIVLFFVRGNNYLNYAPNYSKTIMNTDFDDLLTATYKMEDLSTMERIYRWVAGGNMIKEHPFMGFGPATFYRNYKGYVVTDFQTYVSDNPEKSGMHNYFLMTAVEQGVIGFILLLVMMMTTLIIAERVYHQTDKIEDKRIIMGSIMSLISIIAILLINDMLETDKIGPFFFVCLAIITHYDIQSKKNPLIDK